MATLTIESQEEAFIEAQALARRRQFAMSIYQVCRIAGPLFLIGIVALWMFFQQYVQLLFAAAFSTLPIVTGWLLPVSYRRQKGRMGSILFLLMLLLDITAIFLLLPEIRLGMTIVYILLIVLAHSLLDAQDGRWFSMLGAFAFSAAVVLGNIWIPSWRALVDRTTASLIEVFMSIATLVTMLFIVRQIFVEQNKFFVQSHRANLEIERRMAAERDQRTLLQSTIARYVSHMAQVARGDLSARVALDGNVKGDEDPLIVLGHQLNETSVSLQHMIVQIRDAAANLGSAAAEILAATTQQASGASEQSAAISQTTTTVDEVKTIAEQASTRAQEVATASQQTVQVSRSGQRAVQDTIDSMGQIKERVESIAENILALSEQTQQIGEIIATVNDIASQSNILALNASIEAARAGEHGKGFAVVAVEVRNLAEQSQQATAQVKTILSEIQRATNATVMATEEGTKKVDSGVQLAAQAQQAIEQLSGVIVESAQSAVQVVAGSRQQASGIEQIALAMRNINQTTVQSLSSTRQAEKSAQNLNELARSLAEMVAQYKL